MPIDERWRQLEPSDWEALARAWLAELRGTPEDAESDVGQSVVMMSFTAAPAQQWQFIRAAVSQAESDVELGHVAAGPMEHLLGWHGADCIGAVEELAAADPKFARMLSGVWKHLMNDEVWKRVQALKARHHGSAGDEPIEDVPGSDPVDTDALVELSRKVKDGVRALRPDWQSRGLVDQKWLEEFEASIDDLMRPPPPPPRLGDDPA